LLVISWAPRRDTDASAKRAAADAAKRLLRVIGLVPV
jgi:hypothetical protein